MFAIQSTLTEEEKWHFDLHGFLVLRNVIPPDKIEEMLAILNHWLSIDESELPAPMRRSRQEPCKTHIDHIQYGHKLFQDLAMNPDIIRVVSGLTMNAPRLFHYNFTMMTKYDSLQSFHRDDSGFKFPPGFRNPHNDYQAASGHIYCSHLATWVALVDVPPETGFCLVPGSHKSLFQTPANLPVKHNPPTSITLPMQAGDVTIFSTNLLHDASPWTQDYPRMNIFQRYQLSAYFNESGKGGYPLDEYRDKISDEQYELESLSKDIKAAVQRILPYGGEE
ncbi:phytanoyl-CoA dioxygenase family protein [Candidatus Poribacteria bacterium]|nr:phytanoyl-CoA dioxygenase family protein [Candidatus Poribacteria bacterium]